MVMRLVSMLLSLLVLLVFLGAAVWYLGTAQQNYEDNRAALSVGMDEIGRRIALPFKVAALKQQEPANELPVPVYGVSVSSIADTWHAPRPEGRFHEGVDIFAPRHTPVFSVTEGYVLRSGENELGGRYVYVIGPGGVRYYYSHLERIAQGITIGAPVTTDTVLGYVGTSGNAATTPPHLHFGVYEEAPTNPHPLLVNR